MAVLRELTAACRAAQVAMPVPFCTLRHTYASYLVQQSTFNWQDLNLQPIRPEAQIKSWADQPRTQPALNEVGDAATLKSFDRALANRPMAEVATAVSAR
jgi:hypothetical protein